MTNGLLGFLVFFPFPAGLLSYWLGSMKTKKEIHPCGRSVAVVSVALEFAAALYAFAGFLSGSFGGGTLDLLLPEAQMLRARAFRRTNHRFMRMDTGIMDPRP